MEESRDKKIDILEPVVSPSSEFYILFQSMDKSDIETYQGLLDRSLENIRTEEETKSDAHHAPRFVKP